MDRISQELPKATSDLRRLTADMDTFGYCVVADALPADTVAAIRQRIDEQARAEREQGATRKDDVQEADDGNQWVYMLLNKGRIFQELLTAATVRGVVAHVLGRHYMLSDFAATITHPGNKQMGLHIDQWWLPGPGLPGEPYTRAGSITRRDVAMGPALKSATPINPPAVCNALWMISDFTIENGATRVVPGSHLSGKHPAPKAEQPSVNIAGKAGTCLIFEGRTWHAADYNRSTGPRYGITTYYCAPQFRQMANFTYGTRKAVLDALSLDLKQLIGFMPWGGYGATGDPAAPVIQTGEDTPGEMRPA